ncbi:MAG: hypothetical protein CO001_03220 [Candidatus Portnoybacteria bacterium CG_4_8_14_3_um_filter_40_10]|uniref:Uncharacterized protein n=4 Tax=Candidatus Portnoyibacteriota TaxID=1817913 RepID=A0A2M7IHS6_9BACT|nr:MAG: hypothetical protein COV84_02405 [Candidatus Portnoybacteria bacterium CG11_big_fil_rev_8_21_14_0_20_40_15]PIW76087.1 MAG: hypothetical protein CO001_03220 [Candidatus Portnoybacteria bacterium CG_4_8_14_3_um_filter_40_10]PIY75289.1 MAG: hypothetical protein COY85_00670 [Candidatus Portnoybacteria bacterium CG_4_10_14_0_8_um_filter_40_50]PJA64579.1 MAG: hypothetical protein CO159_02310 [Candidatus Portnoybacteria bacterium CG_4_9_14_3_um_filter_40_10]
MIRRKHKQAGRVKKEKKLVLAYQEHLKKEIEEEMEHSKLSDEAKVVDDPGRYRKDDDDINH